MKTDEVWKNDIDKLLFAKQSIMVIFYMKVPSCYNLL